MENDVRLNWKKNFALQMRDHMFVILGISIDYRISNTSFSIVECYPLCYVGCIWGHSIKEKSSEVWKIIEVVSLSLLVTQNLPQTRSQGKATKETAGAFQKCRSFPWYRGKLSLWCLALCLALVGSALGSMPLPISDPSCLPQTTSETSHS